MSLNRSIKTWMISSLLFCSVAEVFAATSGQYPIKNFTPLDYKAGIQNIDFAQNRNMSVFVANNLGILSFNGNTWERHAFNTGKKQRSLAFDEGTNRLYVGSQGDLGYFSADWVYKSLLEDIPAESRDFDEVWDVYILESKVYFCTFNAIYLYDGDSVKVVKREGGFNRSFLVGNRFMTQSPTGQLFEIAGDQLRPVAGNEDFNQIIAGVVTVEGNQIFIYNSGEVLRMNFLGYEKVYPDLSKTLAGKYVNHVLRLSDSRLVISTQRAGLYIFNPLTNEIENIGVGEGLLSNDCLRTFQDFSGNLWVGMQSGMALIDIDSPMRLLNRDIDLTGSGYEAYETNEGTYFTTSSGVYYMPAGSSASQFMEGTEGPAYGLQEIQGRMYAGHHTGLFLLEESRAIRVASTEGLWHVKQLASNPEFAIGGTYSGLFLFRINPVAGLEPVQKIDGFDESSRFFEEDRNGQIWVGQYYKGLFKIDLDESLTSGQVINVSEQYDSLPLKEHIILSRVDDELVIGTERGVYRVDQVESRILKDEDYGEWIGDQWVYLLTQDKLGNVHVYAEDLVGYFKPVSSSNSTFVASSLFQLRQSFNNDLLQLSRNIDGAVYYNANVGFIYYDPALEEPAYSNKEPLIRTVRSVASDSLLYTRLPFEKPPENIEAIQITQGTRVLQFEVESFQYSNISDGQYRYLLDGFDEGYGEWTTSMIKEYTNLKEGNYQFRVQTFNSVGEIITSQPLDLRVKPPFYKSLTARIIYVLAFILILNQIYRIQRQHYRRKQLAMEEAKQSELDDKQKEIQKFKEEQIKTELRHVNNLLASSTMNLVVKNEFMESIKEEIKRVDINGKAEDAQKALKKIVREIDTTLKVQEDWKQFEFHFDQVHGDFLSRLTAEFTDLTPGEQKLCAFLRLKMDTKEIANLMSISLRGVEVARYRLRKKLDLSSEQNLSKFILEY